MPGAEAQNEALSLSDLMKLARCTPITLTFYAENLNKNGSVVSEIQPDKVKSQGRVYSSRQLYLARYDICDC